MGYGQPGGVFVLDGRACAVIERDRQSRSMDRFERSEIDCLRGVRDEYLAGAATDTHRYCVINASQPVNQVSQTIVDHLEARFA